VAGLNLLLTGPPGSGKSTLIERIIARLSRPLAGFYTREIRQGGRRVGFSLITLDGREGVLARRGLDSPFKVGVYGVNLADLDRLAVPALEPSGPDCLVVIDEIGRMECFSAGFRRALLAVLDSENDVLGSISLKGGSFIQAIKARPDVELIQIGPANRDDLVSLAERFGRPGRLSPSGSRR